MKDYHGEWLHLRNDDPNVSLLLTAYQVKTIPALVVVDSNGGIMASSARNDVYQGPSMFFKWKSAIPMAPPQFLFNRPVATAGSQM